MYIYIYIYKTYVHISYVVVVKLLNVKPERRIDAKIGRDTGLAVDLALLQTVLSSMESTTSVHQNVG